MAEDTHHRRYWRSNLLLVGVLLAVWAVAGFVLPIFLVEPLNAIPLGGFKLGFWFAQQGSMVIFIVLVLIYALLADRLDRAFHVEERGRRKPDA
jgi:putative solute:sodium symporter small subunit